MLPGFLTRAAELLLGREGRSLHLKAARAATAVLGVVMVVGITTYGLVTAAPATWFVGREQRRRRHLARGAQELGEKTVRALPERFDRLERMVAERDGNSADL